MPIDRDRSAEKAEETGRLGANLVRPTTPPTEFQDRFLKPLGHSSCHGDTAPLKVVGSLYRYSGGTVNRAAMHKRQPIVKHGKRRRLFSLKMRLNP